MWVRSHRWVHEGEFRRAGLAQNNGAGLFQFCYGDAIAVGLPTLIGRRAAFGSHRLIGWISDLADYAERVGNRTRLLIAR